MIVIDCKLEEKENKVDVYRDHLNILPILDMYVYHICRRATYCSLYEKNPDDQIHSSVVPDDVIKPQSDNYWAPHPQTGVFGPATDSNTAAGGDRSFYSASATNAGAESVLEEKAWFRPTSLEDLEKPHHQP